MSGRKSGCSVHEYFNIDEFAVVVGDEPVSPIIGIDCAITCRERQRQQVFGWLGSQEVPAVKLRCDRNCVRVSGRFSRIVGERNKRDIRIVIWADLPIESVSDAVDSRRNMCIEPAVIIAMVRVADLVRVGCEPIPESNGMIIVGHRYSEA